MKYAVVIEKAQSNLSTHIPNIPGCVANGASIEEVERKIWEVIEFHIEGMQNDGEIVTRASSSVEYIEFTA